MDKESGNVRSGDRVCFEKADWRESAFMCMVKEGEACEL